MATHPSSFGVPKATLLEDSERTAQSLMAPTPEAMDSSPRDTVANYKPPDPVSTPSSQTGWSDTESNPLEAPLWKPIKEVAPMGQVQESLSHTMTRSGREQQPLKLVFALDQARPAGAEELTS